MKSSEKIDPSRLKALFFDLDGTLLQVEMHAFIPDYLRELGEIFVDTVSPARFSRVARHAVQFLLEKGDPERTNRERYLSIINAQLDIHEELFEERLQLWLGNGLESLAGHVSPIENARSLLDYCFSLDVPIVLATNPVFPAAVVEARLAWAGLDGYPFSLITSYENTWYCKPQPGYFQDLLERFDVSAEEILMVGNDTEHDLAAAALGIPTFLADTFMVDRLAGNFSYDYRGSLEDLLRMLKSRC